MSNIKVVNLSKSYSGKSAVVKFSFEAVSGDLIGILGSNGAGKSTLIKMLAGVVAPDKGDVVVNGSSIRTNKRAAQAQLGYLPEAPIGFDDLTVYEFLSFSACSHGIYGQDMEDAISRICNDLSMEHVKFKKLSSLSKGWRQRAWLGQSLVHNPSLLFLDEPTDGFDPIQKIAMREHIKSTSKNRIVFMSTHILEEAESMCNRIIIMNKGRLVKEGKASSFFDQFGRLENTMKAFAI